jgi:hypothetical protein
MTMNLDLLQDWSRRLCNVSANDVGEVAAALGIPGSVVQHGNDAVTIEPPLPGATQIELGRRQGAFTRVAVALAASKLTRADFERRFGAGNVLPRVGAGRPYEIAYQVAVPGAPFTCAVFAKIGNFDDLPNDASVVTEVTLRRDRVAP